MSDNMIMGSVYMDKNGVLLQVVDQEARDRIGELSEEKIGKQQGMENAEKLLYVGIDGTVVNAEFGDGLEVKHIAAGKNIVFGEWQGGNYNSNGELANNPSSTTNACIAEKFSVTPGATYTVSSTANTEGDTFLYVIQYDASGGYISTLTYVINFGNKTSKQFVVDAKAAYISVYTYGVSAGKWEDAVPEGFMIEVGETASAYEPYIDAPKIVNAGFDKAMLIPDYTVYVPNDLKGEFENAWIANTGAYYKLNTGVSYVSNPEFWSVLPKTSYTLKCTIPESCSVYAFYYSDAADGAFLSKTSMNGFTGSAEFTTVENAAYVRLVFYKQDISIERFTPSDLLFHITGEVVIETKERRIANDRIDVVGLAGIMANNGLMSGSPTVPEYYFENGYLTGKCTRLAELYDTCAGNGDAFFFVTDQHWHMNAQRSPALMRYIADRVNIPRTFSGGDTGNKPVIEYVDMLDNVTNTKVYHAPGNHEYFYGADGNHLARVFDSGKSEQIGNTYRHYYYADNPQQKIRYIVLNPFDTGDANNPSSISVVSKYETEQVAWLTNTALKVDDGWTAIVFTHALYYGFGEEATFVPWPDGASDVISALDSATCDVACVFTGHAHLDRILHTPGGIPVVVTTSDKYMPWIDNGTDMEPWMSNRVAGTITEQAFDVVVLDKAQRKLTIVRIGAPADNWVDGTSTGTVEERVVTY